MCTQRGKGRREQIGRLGLTSIHTVCEIDVGEPAVSHRELSLVLCDDLDGWDMVWDGREVQEEEEICIYIYS